MVVSAIAVDEIVVRIGALRHAYKIVCRAKTLEHGSNVTPGWKPK
jgi:hypothetical protein